jgi:hypothetical protein
MYLQERAVRSRAASETFSGPREVNQWILEWCSRLLSLAPCGDQERRAHHAEHEHAAVDYASRYSERSATVTSGRL